MENQESVVFTSEDKDTACNLMQSGSVRQMFTRCGSHDDQSLSYKKSSKSSTFVERQRSGDVYGSNKFSRYSVTMFT